MARRARCQGQGCRSFQGWVALLRRETGVIFVIIILGQILGDVVVFRIELGHGEKAAGAAQ